MQAQPTTTKRRCAAMTKTGTQCQVDALPGGELCWHHDPSKAAERAAARSKGGKARHGRAIRHIIDDTPPAALRTHGDMQDVLEHALRLALALEPSNQAVRSIVAVVTAAARVYEVSELAQRIEALEAATFGEKARYDNGRY